MASDEGKGLDLVVEVHVGGSAAKDFETNVARYAPRHPRVLHLRSTRSPHRRLPPAGRFASRVLGLDLVVEDGLVRFYSGTAPLLFMDELVGRLNAPWSPRSPMLATEEARRAEGFEQRVRELVRLERDT